MATKIYASRKTAIAILLIATFLFFISVIVSACFPFIYNIVLNEQLSLVNNSMAFEMWRDLPVPIFEKLYYYNITNVDSFLKKKEKLQVSQVGPYVFEANWKKHHIQWHPNKTVSYEEMRDYTFCPNQSSGSLDDEIFTFNGPLIMAGNFIKDWNIALRIGASGVFWEMGEKLIIKKSIKDLTYDGYEDPIIKDAKYIMQGLPFKNGMFAWLAGKNGTYDGRFTVFTGEDDIKKLNIINNWNGQEKLTFWKNDTCNMINGTSAETNPPLDDGQRELTFFQSFFCRSLTFNYNDTDVDHKGIHTKRFSATEKIVANGTDNPDNYCFDTEPNLRSGILDIGACEFGAPVYLSFPHFFLADPYYEKAVNGLNSSGADYNSYIDVEPTTGLSVGIKLNFQLNLQVSSITGIAQLSSIPEGFFPILWAEIMVTLPDDLSHMLKTKLYQPKVITYSVLGVVIGIAVALIIVSITILIKGKQSHQTCDNDDDPILGSTQDFDTSLSKRVKQSAPPLEESQEEESKPTGFKSVERVEREERIKRKDLQAAATNPAFNADDELLIDS